MNWKRLRYISFTNRVVDRIVFFAFGGIFCGGLSVTMTAILYRPGIPDFLLYVVGPWLGISVLLMVAYAAAIWYWKPDGFSHTDSYGGTS